MARASFILSSINVNAPGAQDPTNGTPNPETPSDTITNDRFTTLDVLMFVNTAAIAYHQIGRLRPIPCPYAIAVVFTNIDKIMLKLVFYDHHIEENKTKRQAEMEGRLTQRQIEMEERLTRAIQISATQLKLELKLGDQEKNVSHGGRSWWN
ncbi:unnamed protein product [Tuber aestivum]|uniref:Uncharacterized protein n=1 Tax=Tuber aestivum TaxID=59557 RepID=A0A292PPW1_9PEZI|nr:unnamed protein product [Tuber aestivum]